MKSVDRFFCLLLLLISGTGCNSYLDLRAKSNMTTPSTLVDCQGLLDDYSKMNTGYPSDGEGSADNYYLAEANFNALSAFQDRERYVWEPAGLPVLTQYMNPYRVVYNANLVLQTLDDIGRNTGNASEYDRLRGSALFFRGYAFYALLPLFAPPYHPGGDNDAPAIPLRLSPDVDEASKRATVAGAYAQVISDLKSAATLLPVGSSIVTRPDQTAALAALARVYLAMQDYEKAGQSANEALNLKDTLLDYNQISSTASIPFSPRFNAEVIFHSLSTVGGQFASTRGMADSNLITSYDAMDLRKMLFYTVPNAIGQCFFRGSYDGTRNGTLFTGLTTAELYLIRAECRARAGNTAGALADLNELLVRRWTVGAFVPFTTANSEQALSLILQERRKELVFRDLRWGDLRRLNQEPRFQLTLRRQLGDLSYNLPPNDARYTLLLPQEVIETAHFQQNAR